MFRYILIFVAAGLLTGLVWAESTGNNWLALGFKTPLSILFVITVLLQPKVFPKYFKFVLVGLIFGLVGDVCLALPGLTAFRVGLVAFLAGHILYILAFAILTRRADWISPVNILIIAISGCVYLWLLPNLGKMLVPVTFYIVVISVMVAAAWAVFRNSRVRRLGAWFILVGAVLFYVSDIFVAHQRFVMEHFYNRLIGLPLYYTAQFLLAFSVGLVKSRHSGENRDQ
ncbi:putative membrane protein YhhN [Candidatus Methanophagaceae archaeon]|nr:putative membrane protein YhhN [Methanophagales archaeon]